MLAQQLIYRPRYHARSPRRHVAPILGDMPATAAFTVTLGCQGPNANAHHMITRRFASIRGDHIMARRPVIWRDVSFAYPKVSREVINGVPEEPCRKGRHGSDLPRRLP